MYPLPSLAGGMHGQNAGYQVTPPRAYLGTPSTPTNHFQSPPMRSSGTLGLERWNPNVELLSSRIGFLLHLLSRLEWMAPSSQGPVVCPWPEEYKLQLVCQTYQTNPAFQRGVEALAETWAEQSTDESVRRGLIEEVLVILYHHLMVSRA
jgi:hypothetical protein